MQFIIQCQDISFKKVIYYIHGSRVTFTITFKLCRNPDEYKWSSYKEYIDSSYFNRIIDTRFAISMIGLNELIKYTTMDNTDNCLEYAESKFFLTDDEAKVLMMEICKCDTAEAFKKLSTQKRNEYIKALGNSGISIRQLGRISGISKGIVDRVLRLVELVLSLVAIVRHKAAVAKPVLSIVSDKS